MANVQVRRIYDPEEPGDGARILVDRLWPRGVSNERADLTEWCKQVAPSTDLRKWYDHDPAKFDEFAQRYREELKDADHADAFADLKKRASEGKVTLLTASKASNISEATVLADLLNAD